MANWIAITGGCGYVGSHIAAEIKRTTKTKVLLIDNRARALTHTHQWADDVIHNSYDSGEALHAISSVRPKAVIHCAAASLVGPSVTDPARYYGTNVAGMLTLLDHMRKHKINNVIFSSSSSVYSDGQDAARENSIFNPVNPYGRTKLVGEMILRDYCAAYGLNAVAFRYFNAVGADPKANLGQEPGATHVIARIMESQIRGEKFHVYGGDYVTPDGTCIRDYVHVSDIARAHVMGMAWLMGNPGFWAYNIGSGQGYSVLEVLKTVEIMTGKPVDYEIQPRRAGDPAFTLADTSLIKEDLKWQPIKTLRDIVSDATRWYNSDTYKTLV
jgi:UDP-glucose-4-epimerase GalE